MYQLSLKLGCTQGTAELARKNYTFFPHSHSCLLLPDHLDTSHVIIYFCYHLFSHSPSTQRAQTPQRRQFWRSALSVRCLHWGLSITTTPGTKSMGAVPRGGFGERQSQHSWAAAASGVQCNHRVTGSFRLEKPSKSSLHPNTPCPLNRIKKCLMTRFWNTKPPSGLSFSWVDAVSCTSCPIPQPLTNF